VDDALDHAETIRRPAAGRRGVRFRGPRTAR
jgi:hypothetical protein